MDGFFSTLNKQLLGGIRCETIEELRERVYAWFRESDAGKHALGRSVWALDGERYDLDSDPNEAAFRVASGGACRPEDAPEGGRVQARAEAPRAGDATK